MRDTCIWQHDLLLLSSRNLLQSQRKLRDQNNHSRISPWEMVVRQLYCKLWCCRDHPERPVLLLKILDWSRSAQTFIVQIGCAVHSLHWLLSFLPLEKHTSRDQWCIYLLHFHLQSSGSKMKEKLLLIK